MVLKTQWYYSDANLETGLMLLIGYGSYMAGTAAGLSGIVCVMFCAMVCGRYAVPHLSSGGLQASKTVYAVLASCMEQFVFVYIGVSLFMEPQEWHCVAFTVSGIMQHLAGCSGHANMCMPLTAFTCVSNVASKHSVLVVCYASDVLCWLV